MRFSNQQHVDTLLESAGLICHALMLCEGLTGASNQMGDKQYINAAAGAISLLAHALDRVNDLVSEAESDFRHSHGMHYCKNQPQDDVSERVNCQARVTALWLDYYRELTGADGQPEDKDGNVFWWIVEHSGDKCQTAILDKVYKAGYMDGINCVGTTEEDAAHE